jgi:cytochrome c oxidase subunit II
MLSEAAVIQNIVWSVSIVLMGFVGALFAWVAAGADLRLANYGPVIASAYRMRTWIFLLLGFVLILANYRTLGELPYVSRGASTPAAVTRVDAVGEQWSWTIKPDSFEVGQTAEFHVTSSDVNHGFALYAPDMRIVAQTQAMPGYTNVLRYTFSEPGVYQVLCLEYCGLEHHDMKSEINVAAQSEGTQ